MNAEMVKLGTGVMPAPQALRAEVIWAKAVAVVAARLTAASAEGAMAEGRSARATTVRPRMEVEKRVETKMEGERIEKEGER